MVAEKTNRYQGKNKDLAALGLAIADKLKGDGYKVQSKTDKTGTIVQAQKAGILRDILTADRAFTILIQGQPNDFSIKIGIGKFVQNLSVTAVEAVLTLGLFLVVNIPEQAWTVHVQKEIIDKIDAIVNSPQATAAH